MGGPQCGNHQQRSCWTVRTVVEARQYCLRTNGCRNNWARLIGLCHSLAGGTDSRTGMRFISNVREEFPIAPRRRPPSSLCRRCQAQCGATHRRSQFPEARVDACCRTTLCLRRQEHELAFRGAASTRHWAPPEAQFLKLSIVWRRESTAHPVRWPSWRLRRLRSICEEASIFHGLSIQITKCDVGRCHDQLCETYLAPKRRSPS